MDAQNATTEDNGAENARTSGGVKWVYNLAEKEECLRALSDLAKVVGWRVPLDPAGNGETFIEIVRLADEIRRSV